MHTYTNIFAIEDEERSWKFVQVLGERAWRSLEEEQKVATTNGQVIWEEGKAHRRPILISVALSA